MLTKIDNLKTEINGEVILPQDEKYDSARALYNAMIDKYPKIIIKCRDEADIIQAVKFAHENHLETAIRSGGHNGAGLASVDDGLVIDLSEMKGIEINPDARTARVQAGCTWKEVDTDTHEFGLATVSGLVSSTGVGGLSLGGGHGYLTRKYGLTIDNLLEADMVLADGSRVTANANQNQDLFWAIRGGGGNFGVVTSFTFKLHRVDNITGGPMFWPIEDMEKCLKWYRDWQPGTPEDLNAVFVVGRVPSGEPFPKEIWDREMCGIVWFFTGNEEDFEPFRRQAHTVAKPFFEQVGTMPYPFIQSMFDGLYPEGHQQYWKAAFIHELSNEAIREHIRFSHVPTPQSTAHIYPIDGAVHRVGKDETAWKERDANWSMVIFAADPDPGKQDLIKNWARSFWDALQPFYQRAGAVNFMMREGEARVRSTYGENFERLQQIKAKYDPENFFHVNQNIKPSISNVKAV